MLGSLFKAVAVVIDVPVSIAADVVTLGGELNDKDTDGTYTGNALDRFVDNVSDITDPDN